MARSRLRWALVLAAGVAFAARVSSQSASGAGVVIDAKDAALPDVLRLLAAQGGPTVAADPSVAEQKITFAVKEVQPHAALRWLCRACRLVVVSGQGGRLFIGKPMLDKAVLEEYNVASLAGTPAGVEALLDFTKRVVFPSYLNRGKAENSESLPRARSGIREGPAEDSGAAHGPAAKWPPSCGPSLRPGKARPLKNSTSRIGRTSWAC